METASTIVVTPELQEVMREYTKAVMRDTPEDVLEYSQQWFLNKYTERRMGAAGAGARFGTWLGH